MKKVNEIKQETAKKRLSYMAEQTKSYIAGVADIHVSISVGNSKTGTLVPSISLRPVLDCKNCSACNKLCYDLRNDCLYKSVMNSRSKNAAILKADPKRYFEEISAACKFFVSFRWRIGGDIVDVAYLCGMVKVAKENPNTRFLAFTKSFDIVNGYMDTYHDIPENLQIIFSGWVDQKMNNPYNFPTSHPIFQDGKTSAPAGYKLCSGNCSECLIQKKNCWTLKRGEAVAFSVH